MAYLWVEFAANLFEKDLQAMTSAITPRSSKAC